MAMKLIDASCAYCSVDSKIYFRKSKISGAKSSVFMLLKNQFGNLRCLLKQ